MHCTTALSLLLSISSTLASPASTSTSPEKFKLITKLRGSSANNGHKSVFDGHFVDVEKDNAGIYDFVINGINSNAGVEFYLSSELFYLALPGAAGGAKAPMNLVVDGLDNAWNRVRALNDKKPLQNWGFTPGGHVYVKGEKNGFQGFRVCDWALASPQLFWDTGRPERVPSGCALVDLIKVTV